MTYILLPPANVPACGEGRPNVRPNLYLQLQNRRSGYHEAKVGRIVCPSSSREKFQNFSRRQVVLLAGPLAQNSEAWKSRSTKASSRIRRSSARVGECLAQQDVIFQSGRLAHEKPCSFVNELPHIVAPSARQASAVCRVQSVEGAEKAAQEKHRLEGNGETQGVHVEESVPVDTASENAEQVDRVSSNEKSILETGGEHNSGSSQHDSISVTSHDESNEDGDSSSDEDEATGTTPTEELEDWDEEVEYVTRISVPRQKYIPVPKVDLVNALLLLFFPGNKDASKFLSICSYLEIILHTEHKNLLEELRSDYSLTHSVQDKNLPKSSKLLRTRGITNSSKLGTASIERAHKHDTVGELLDWPLDAPAMKDGASVVDKLQQPLKTLTELRTTFMAAFHQENNTDDIADVIEGDPQGPSSNADASEAAAERFQKNFLKILRRAEFEGISVRDLELTAALNSDYLLTLPVDVDWKRTSSSNVKIFRRGYTKEAQKGLLLGAKLDYLQSLILRQSFKGFTGPLLHAGRWCMQTWKSLWGNEEGGALAKSLGRWLQEPLQPEIEEPLNAPEQEVDHGTTMHNREGELDMPIWLAARQAIPRYEAVLSSAGSRGLLIRRVLQRMGLLQMDSPSLSLPTYGDEGALEPHLRPNHLSRVSMKDIWLPASKAVVGGNPLRIISATFSVFFSQATLQEPAFKELVLLYNGDAEGDSEEAGLQLHTYKKIPIPDLKIVFPSKKLIFRVLDTLKLDITSIVGLLAFTVNYRFDNFWSSPSAFVLDLIATSALVVFVTRVSFGYKQVWDRYQLLVNKTLCDKTVARGFEVVQFLLDESEEQQFKEAVLVFILLMHQDKAGGMTAQQLADSCEQFLYYRCKEQVEMPVESAVDTLLRFGLIAGDGDDGDEEMSPGTARDADVRFRALPYEQGLTALEQHWVSLPSNMSLWN